MEFFGGSKRILLNQIQKAGQHGISINRLVDALYQDRIDGGALTARKTIHVHIWQMNQKLKEIGYRIVCPRTGRGVDGFYVLQKL